MSDKIDIAKIFRENRRALCLTQEGMAAKLGMGRARYAAYEEGRSQPSISDLLAIVEKLNFKSVEDFLQVKIDNREKRHKMIIAYEWLSQEKKEIVDFILGIKK